VLKLPIAKKGARGSQLSVVQGLVMERVQSITQKTLVFDNRCCRASYGVLCQRPYIPYKHVGEDVTIDHGTGKKWVLNQIDWLVIQVNPLKPPSPLFLSFSPYLFLSF
jgi:hypothetical protein